MDETARTLVAFGEAFDELSDSCQRRGATKHREGQVLSVEYERGARDAFQVVAESMREVALLPAGERVQHVANLALVRAGDVAAAQEAR